MKANCTDCNKFLPQINYMRDVRLSHPAYCVPRDPLCKKCWEKDSVKLRELAAKKEK